MSPRSPRGRLLLITAFVAGFALIGVASAVLLRERPVAVDPPAPAGAAAAACAALARELPASVAGQDRRDVAPASMFTAAWGRTPVVLRCGVGRPSALGPTSGLTVVDAVAWLPERLEHGYRYTATGRVAYVEVTVPDAYHPEGTALVDLAAAVGATVPLTGDGRP